jgi:hypothetical protein
LADIVDDGDIGDHTATLNARFQMVVDRLGCGASDPAHAEGLERFDVRVRIRLAHGVYRESEKVGDERFMIPTVEDVFTGTAGGGTNAAGT